MVADPTDDAVLSLDEVFDDDDVVSLALSGEEWEVILALAEAGGSGSMLEISRLCGLASTVVEQVIRSLVDRGILLRRSAEPAVEAAPSGPDAEVARYLEELQGLNFYQVLKLKPDAGHEDIRRSYFQLMRAYNPDRFMSEANPETREQLKETFRILTRAYETLSDPESRREYDLTIPEFTGALDKQDDQAIEELWAGGAGAEPDPLPEQNPDMARSFFENALDDFRKNDFQSAELNFKLAVSLDPENPDYQAGLAKTQRILHKKKAKECVIKALFMEEEKNLDRAVSWMSRAVELDPEEAEYRHDLARLLLARGRDLAAARMHVLLALDRRPGNIEYLLLFGKIQERLKEYSDARRTFKRILSLDPGHKEARLALDGLKKR